MAPQTHWLGDTKKITHLYILHLNIFYVFEALDAMFEHLSHTSARYLERRCCRSFLPGKKNPRADRTGSADELYGLLADVYRQPEAYDECVSAFQEQVNALEELMTDSLIVIKTDVMNQTLFYCREMGVSEAFQSPRLPDIGKAKNGRPHSTPPRSSW